MNLENILQTTSVRWYNACAYYSVFVSLSLEQSGYKIIYTSDPDSPPYTQAVKHGLNVHPINFASLVPHTFIFQLKKLMNTIKNNGIQIINCHRPEDHLFAGIAGRKLNIPVVRTVGDIRPPHPNAFNKWLHLKATDFFIFTCEMNRSRYISVWPEIADRSIIILGGVDTEQFKPIQKTQNLFQKYNLPSDVPLVGLIGRLSKLKDIPTFVRAAKLVKEKLPDTKFIISGQEFSVKISDLKKIAKELDIDQDIIFLDRVDSVSELINMLSVGVIASKDSEAICRIGMEYVACGTPVVATDVNVLPEVIQDGVNGFIAQRQNPFEMAQHVIKILERKALSKNIHENNLRDAQERFSKETTAKQTIEAYELAIHFHKSKAKP